MKKGIILLLCLLPWGGDCGLWAEEVAPALAQALQERLDALTPCCLATIDLAAEGLTGRLETTVYVRGGRHVRLVNGTLLTDCGIVVTDGSHVELGAQAVIEGSISCGAYSQFEENPLCPSLVYLDGGTLTVGVRIVCGAKGWGTLDDFDVRLEQ